MNIMLGFILGIICFLLGILISGAGHGWTSAFSFGIISLILSPLAFWTLGAPKKERIYWLLFILGIGILLDITLYDRTMKEGLKYFTKNIGINILWLTFWVSWQVIPILIEVYKRNTPKTK